MKLFLLAALLLAMLLPVSLALSRLNKLEKVLETQEKRINELSDENIEEDFEQAYKKGLAGIMAYSLTQAQGEAEEL